MVIEEPITPIIKRFCKNCKREFVPAEPQNTNCALCGGLAESTMGNQTRDSLRIYDLSFINVVNIHILRDNKRAVVNSEELYLCEDPFDDHGRLPLRDELKNALSLWDLETFSRIETLNDPTFSRDFMNAGLAVSPDDRYALIIDSYPGLRLFDLESETEVHQFEPQQCRTYSGISVCISRDGKYVYGGDYHGFVWQWELASGVFVRKLECEHSLITQLVLLTSGDLVTVTENGELRRWQISTGECLAVHQTKKNITAVVPTNDDRLLFSTSEGRIYQWNPLGCRPGGTVDQESTIQDIYKGLAGWVNALTLTIDGGAVLAGGTDGTLRLIELSSGSTLRSYKPPGDYAKEIRCLALSPDGRRALVGSGYQLHLWEWAEPLSSVKPSKVRPFESDLCLPPGYKAEKLLARSELRRIYRARHLRTGKFFTAEILITKPLQFAEFSNYYLRMVDILFNLKGCRHIIQIDHARRWNEYPILFTQPIDGYSLYDYTQKGYLYNNDPLENLERVLNLAIQMAHALACLHRRRIVHADVKPSAFLISADGEIFLYRLHLAMKLPEGEDLVLIKGHTPAYCSPEQAKGCLVGMSTDLWSWGSIVLELFAGQRFWVRPDLPGYYWGQVAPHALEYYLSGELEDPAIPTMPDGLPELLRDCFKPQAERPQSILPLLNRLTDIYEKATGNIYPESLVDLQSMVIPVEDLSLEGISFFELGDYKRAVECFTRYVKASPENGWGWLNLGFARLCLNPGHPEAAWECFEHYPGYQDAGLSIGQLADHFISIQDIRMDMNRKLVWVSGDTGISMIGGPYYSAYSFQGVNVDPGQILEPKDGLQVAGRRDECSPWLASIENPDTLGTRPTVH